MTPLSPIVYPTHLETDTLLKLYRQLIKPRLVEEKMLLLLRQGKVTKWFSSIARCRKVLLVRVFKPATYYGQVSDLREQVLKPPQ